LLTAARTNWNFEFARTANNIRYKTYKPFEKNVNVFLSTFADVCYLFIINGFVNAYYYFWTFNTSMVWGP